MRLTICQKTGSQLADGPQGLNQKIKCANDRGFRVYTKFKKDNRLFFLVLSITKKYKMKEEETTLIFQPQYIKTKAALQSHIHIINVLLWCSAHFTERRRKRKRKKISAKEIVVKARR